MSLLTVVPIQAFLKGAEVDGQVIMTEMSYTFVQSFLKNIQGSKKEKGTLIGSTKYLGQKQTIRCRLVLKKFFGTFEVIEGLFNTLSGTSVL